MAGPNADVLRERYAPLTEAEANLVLRRVGDRDLDEVVAEVKAERVGTARRWEADHAARRQRAVAREQEAAGVWSDERIVAANASEIVAYLKDHPEDVDRVVAIEADRDTPRKSVLAAAGIGEEEA